MTSATRNDLESYIMIWENVHDIAKEYLIHISVMCFFINHMPKNKATQSPNL